MSDETRPRAPDPVRILSMDGGPGPLYHLRLLREIERRNPGFIERTDVFAGTSDGALVSLCLAKHLAEGRSGAEALDACAGFAEEYSGAFSEGASFARFLSRDEPYSDGRRFREALARRLGETTLDDLHARGRHVAITTFNANPWRPRFYRSFGPGWARNPDDGPRKLREVAHDTSSVPGVMPVGLSQGVAYLDGFLASNNPSVSALSVVVRDIVRRSHPGEDPFNHVVLLSLGVGQTFREADIERRGGFVRNLIELFSDDRRLLRAAAAPSLRDSARGLFRGAARASRGALADEPLIWGAWSLGGHLLYLVDMMLHGQSAEIDHNCERLLGSNRFHRYEPRIDLMRAVVRFLFKRGHGSAAAMEALYRSCFGDARPEDADDAREADENRRRTDNTLAWIARSWMADPPTMGADTPDDGIIDAGFTPADFSAR